MNKNLTVNAEASTKLQQENNSIDAVISEPNRLDYQECNPTDFIWANLFVI